MQPFLQSPFTAFHCSPPITSHCISLQPSHHLSLHLTAALPSPPTASHYSPSIHPLTYRKALYIGRYQQTKEQGVKRSSQSIDSPKPEPLLVSTQNLARQAKKFRRRARVLPEGQRRTDRVKGPSGLQQSLSHKPAQWPSPTMAAEEEDGARALENQPQMRHDLFAKTWKEFRIHLCMVTEGRDKLRTSIQ